MEKKFTEFSKNTWQKLLGKIFSQKFKDITGAKYLTYEQITLKDYYEIASTGNHKKLMVAGKFNELEAAQAWEEIIKDNCKATNNRKYLIYLEAHKNYLRYIGEQTFLKAALLKLHFELDRELIKEVEKVSLCHINLSSSEKYAQSLKECDNRAKSWNTKINTQKVLLERMRKEEEGKAKGKGPNFQQSLVRVGTALNIVIPQDVLLCTFNEYVNVIKSRETNNRRAA
jgi:hypothetical protein